MAKLIADQWRTLGMGVDRSATPQACVLEPLAARSSHCVSLALGDSAQRYSRAATGFLQKRSNWSHSSSSVTQFA